MRRPFHRSAAISLALCAMLLRALLPDGWMPSADAAVSPFVICSVDSAHHDGKTTPVHEQGHAPCAFAASAPLAPPSFAAILTAVAFDATRFAAPFRQDRLAAAPPLRHNAARAPPAFS